MNTVKLVFEIDQVTYVGSTLLGRVAKVNKDNLRVSFDNLEKEGEILQIIPKTILKFFNN